MRFAIAFLLTAMAWPVAAQTVYKCKAADGATEYSQKPCSTDASKVEAVEVKPQRPSSTDASANFAAMSKDNERASIGHRENGCIQAANDRIYIPLQNRLDVIAAKIRALYADMATANNNLAGATYANGIREQISGLEAARVDERASADRLFAEERQRCMDTRRQDEAEFREKHEPREKR